MANQPEGTIKLPYRSTRMGGLTLPLVVKVHEKVKVLEPIRKVYSRTGHHGEWIYSADFDCYFLLNQSNSGKRSVYMKCLKEGPEYAELKRRVVNMWFDYMSYDEIIQQLQQTNLNS
jgi:hypothetical protein